MMRRLRAYLVTPQAGTLIPCLVIALPTLSAASRMAMQAVSPSMGRSWQISGYYLDGLLFGLLLLLLAAWVTSIVGLMAQRSIRKGIARLVAIPVIGFVSLLLFSFASVFMASEICGWPTDTVYSQSRGKHYILAVEPASTDVCYRVLSADGSRFAPIWKVEFSGSMVDYSEDGTMTSDPHLILSGNEQLLAIARGGQLSDAIVIDTGETLTDPMGSSKGREPAWQQRTDWITGLLEANAAGATPPAIMVGSKIEIPAGTPVEYDYRGSRVVIGDPLAGVIIATLNQRPGRAEMSVYMELDSQKQLRVRRRDLLYWGHQSGRHLYVGGRTFGVDEFGLHLLDDWGYRVWFLDGMEAKLDAAAD